MQLVSVTIPTRGPFLPNPLMREPSFKCLRVAAQSRLMRRENAKNSRAAPNLHSICCFTLHRHSDVTLIVKLFETNVAAPHSLLPFMYH